MSRRISLARASFWPAAVAALLACGTSPAPAQINGPHVTIRPYVGGVSWAKHVNLNDRPIYGGSIGLMASKYFGIEGLYDRTDSRTKLGGTPWTPLPGASGSDSEYAATRWAVNLVANLAPHGKVSPYVTGGYTQVKFDSKNEGLYDEKDKGFDLGAGVLVRALPRLNLRFEGMDVGFRFHNALSPYGDDLQHNIFYSAGLQFSLGGSVWTPPAATTVVTEATPPPPPPAPEVVHDTVAVKQVGDADADGVPDDRDQCPGTPVGCQVDARGCPIDSDNDGVCDGLDKCPNTPANARVDKDGCPIMGEREVELLETGRIVVSNVHFKTAKWDVVPEDEPVLEEVGKVLSEWPQLRIEIGGHCDSRGSDAYNMRLSQNRARSVRDWLLEHFPAIRNSQYTAVGYGERRPVAPNNSVENMARNRRVEFKVLNTEELRKIREEMHYVPKSGSGG